MSEPAQRRARSSASAAVVRAARALAAAQDPAEGLQVVLSAFQEQLGARGAALLQVEPAQGQLVPAATRAMRVAGRPLDERALASPDGGYALLLGGRLEGVLMVEGVAPRTLAARERMLRALLDLAAIALRNARLSVERERLRQEMEVRSLEQLAVVDEAPAARLTAPAGPLQVVQPPLFAELRDQYARLLDAALEQRAFRVEYRLSDRVRALVERLGAAGAGPRDVVDLHTAALRARLEHSRAERRQAYMQEGRLVVLETMGHLASYYRDRHR